MNECITIRKAERKKDSCVPKLQAERMDGRKEGRKKRKEKKVDRRSARP